MANWKILKLGDVLTLKRGYDLPKQDRVEGAIPIYSSSGLSGFHIEAKVKGPGVVTGRYGTLGEVFYTEKDYWPHNTTLYVKDFKGNHPKFIYYFIQTLGFNDKNDKTSVPGLNRNHLHDLPVSIPNPHVQRRIAEILSALDDKIELNLRMNITLEQMAQTLFRQYFVNGIDEENLPEGWSKGTLNDVIDIKHGFAFKGEFISDEPTENILVTPGNFRIGGGFHFKKYKYYSGSIPKDYVLAKDDLVVTMTDLSKDGDTLGYSALVPIIPHKALLHNQRIGKVVFKSELPLKFYLYWLMRSDSYRASVLGSASGSTVKHTSPSRILEYKCIVPSAEALFKFESIVCELYEKEHANHLENFTLSTLRDTLLPKLMSGEIDVMQTQPEALHEPVLS